MQRKTLWDSSKIVNDKADLLLSNQEQVSFLVGLILFEERLFEEIQETGGETFTKAAIGWYNDTLRSCVLGEQDESL